MIFSNNTYQLIKNSVIISLISIFSFSSLAAEDVRAVVDRNSLSVNDVFNFQIIIENGNTTPNVNISPVLENFSVISGPSQHTSMNWINGKMSSTRKISWTLVPKKVGKLTIPALDVKFGKSTVKTNPISISVLESSGQESSKDLFIHVEADINEAYLGQQITVSYKLYTRVNMSIQDLQLPEFRGFWSEELYLPKQIDFRDATLNGVSYKVANLYKVAIFPTALGHVTLPPLTLKTQVETRRQQSGRRSLFDDPFFNSLDPFGRQMVPKILRSENISLHIIDFPGEVPGDFDNAVGSFTVSSFLDSNSLRVNEATTLHLLLSGTGNLNLITLPEPVFPEGLEVFPPTTSIEKEPFRDQITGKANWDYIIIPRQAGKVIIPPISIVTFDPKEKEWKRLQTRALDLTVTPGIENSFSGNGHTKEEIQLLNSDIRYIHTDLPDWNFVNFSSKRISIIVFYSLAILTLFFPFLFGHFKVTRSNSFLSRRSSGAAKQALKKLKHFKGDPYSVASKTMYQFLRDRFYLKSEKLDPHQVETDLMNKIPKAELEELIIFLKRCDAGQYAPDDFSGLEDPVETAKNIIKRIN